MTSSPAPQARTGWTSLLIKQRERAANPQLRCVPSDLRVDGARHASHESLPPSKPCRPPASSRREWPITGYKVLAIRSRHCTAAGLGRQTILFLGVVAVTRLDFAVRPPDNAEHSSPHRLRAASVDMTVDEQRFQDQNDRQLARCRHRPRFLRAPRPQQSVMNRQGALT
jgi:hypothetical protein